MAANLLLKMKITSKGAHRDSYRPSGDAVTGNHTAPNTNSNLNSNIITANTNMTKHIQTSEDISAIITNINALGLATEKEAIQMALLNLIDGVNSGKVTPDNQRDYLLVLGLAWENFKKSLLNAKQPRIHCLDCTLRAIVIEALRVYDIDNERYESVVEGFVNQIEKANTLYSFDDCSSLIGWIKGEVCADLLRQFKDWLENNRPDLLRFVGMSYSDISEEWDGAPIYMGNLPLLALKNRFYIGEKCFNIGDAMELDSFDIFEMMESLGDNHGHWDWVPGVVGGFFRAVA